MSQKEMEKENSPKTVLTEIQNQTIIVSSQGEVKSQLQAASQDRVPSQVQTEAQLASQDSVLTQARSVSSQPIVPPPSQKSSQRSVSSSQDAASSQKGERSDIIADMPSLVTVPGQQSTSSEDSQDARQKTNE